MVLTSAQINELANAITAHSNQQKLELYSAAIGYPLRNLVYSSLKEGALKLIADLNTQTPPMIDQLLEKLRVEGNAALKVIANRLLTPNYYSPDQDPHNAILLGTTAFVARDDLRSELRKFTNANQFSTRILIVRGDQPGGKSYTWEFLRHIAIDVGARPVKLGLKGTSYTPRQFMEQVYRLLRLNLNSLPDLIDNPQLALIDPLINDFKGQVDDLDKRHWLVIDDLNDPGITVPIKETAFALASAVEEMRPSNLWVALLGFNDPIADVGQLRKVSRDYAEFPSEDLVAEFLDLVADASPKKLPSGRAKEMAKLLFNKFAPLDKEAMMRLTVDLEDIGEKLRQGLQP